MNGPRLLDLFSCAGGAAKGYTDAGFDVYGIDIVPQPRYPYPHHVGDAVAVLRELIAGAAVTFTQPDGQAIALTLADFAVVHASPPCQAFSKTRTLHSNTHPELVEPTRDALVASGLPWVIENVVGAPLIDPLVLCGTEFGMVAPDVDGVLLKVVRHRLFESSIPLMGNGGCRHDRSIQTATIYGAGGGWAPAHRDSPDRRGGYIPATSVIQKLLGIDWMTKHEMSQVVPPVMAEHIGRQLLTHLEGTSHV